MAHFRDTYRPARFLFLDVRVGVVLLATLLHIRLWTLSLDVIVICIAFYVERIGLGFMGAVRATRAWFAGTYRPALRREKIRRKVDWHREPLAWEKKLDMTPHRLREVEPDKKTLINDRF